MTHVTFESKNSLAVVQQHLLPLSRSALVLESCDLVAISGDLSAATGLTRLEVRAPLSRIAV